jgi:hypothetical protein
MSIFGNSWICVLLFAFLAPSFAQGADQISLAAGGLKVKFDLEKKGGIVSVRNGAVDVVHPDFSSPTLFRIGVVNGTSVSEYSNDDFDTFSHEAVPGGLRLLYRGVAGKELEVAITAKAKDGYVAFSAHVECGAETICSDIKFPYIDGYDSLSGNPADDTYLYPRMSGRLYKNPKSAVRGKNGQLLSPTGYPGTQGVQMHALYNDNGGVVMYAADPDCYPKQFDMKLDRTQDSVGWFVMHYFDETPGFVFERDYEVRLQACGPSWFDAADAYAEWSRQQWWMEKKVARPEWLNTMPPMATVHDNSTWAHQLPSWIAANQPGMNALFGRPLICSFAQWEHYDMWIAPDSFPPRGGESAMIEAANSMRAAGNHLKHLFSCGQYWLHQDITDDYYNDTLKKMVVVPRNGRSDKDFLAKQHPRLGKFIPTCPASPEFQERMVQYADKLGEYRHELISMDIWPIGQPNPCWNPRHNHPPGCGKWYVDANIKMIKDMQAAVFAREPEAYFGGEGMAEPYMPWMHTTLMRSAMHPGPANQRDIPMYDYLYGDQVMPWGMWATTKVSFARQQLAIQFVRRKILSLSDRWAVELLDLAAMNVDPNRQPGDPIPDAILRSNIQYGGETERAADIAFACKANDIQIGPFSRYFTDGRLGRFPKCFAKDEGGTQWRELDIYGRNPAVGAMRHPDNGNILWAFGNGTENKIAVRLEPLADREIARHTLNNGPQMVDFNGREYLEVILEPVELAVLEWDSEPAGAKGYVHWR